MLASPSARFTFILRFDDSNMRMCMSKIHYELFSVDRQLSNSKAHVAERSAMEVHRGQVSTLCSITSTLGATLARS